MMKPFLSSFAGMLTLGALSLATAPAHAKVWNVAVVFGANAQAAHNSASVVSGDTLYFNGGANYGSLILTKKLAVIGAGYFLDENPQTQVEVDPAIITGLTFNAGSQNSQVQGIQLTGSVAVNANDVVLSRNILSSGGYYDRVEVAAGALNTLINRNYFIGRSSPYASVNIGVGCTGMVIRNNVFEHNSGYGAPAIDCSDPSARLEIAQNVFSSSIRVNGSMLFNNIFLDGNATINGLTNTIVNNVASGTQVPTGNGNQQNVPMTNVFVTSGTTDGKYALKAGSPALGAGMSGEDCGLFGGATPYVLSGLPPVPHIWDYTQPTTVPTTGALQVRVKAKSQN